MTTVVLIHGAWHSAECWHRVTPLLEQAGHEVLTPTLVGLGETHALTRRRHMRIGDHVEQITDLLRRRRLRDVVLVGHSYAGIILAEVARVLPSQAISTLVFLDAMVPHPGRNTTASLFRIAEPPYYLRPWAQRFPGYVLRSQPAPPPPTRLFVGQDTSLAAWLAPRLTPMPLWLFDGLRRFASPPVEVPKVYIACHDPDPETRAVPLFSAPFEAYARAQHWPVHVLDCAHDAMLVAPQATATLLLQAASVATG